MNEKNVDPQIIEEILNRVDSDAVDEQSPSSPTVRKESESLRRVLSSMRHTWVPPMIRIPETEEMVAMARQESEIAPEPCRTGLRTITWQWILLVCLATVSALGVHFIRPFVLNYVEALYNQTGTGVFIALGFGLLAIMSSPVIVLFHQPITIRRSC